MEKIVLKNQLIKVEQSTNRDDGRFYIYTMGRDERGRFTYSLNHSYRGYATLEEAVEDATEYIADYVVDNNLNSIFTKEELLEDYYQQLMSDNCEDLWNFLRNYTNFFKGYELLVVTEKNTLAQLKKYAKDKMIKGISKLSKKELINILNDGKYAIKTVDILE